MSSRINALSINPGQVPQASELILGQLAINAADGRIYLELVSGLIICVGADISQFATAEDLADIDLSAYALQATVTQAITGLAQQLAMLSQALSGKAASIHGHTIADVAELGNTLSVMQQGINGKQPSGNYAAAVHTHPIAQVDGLQTAIDSIIASLQTKQPAGNYQPAGSYAALAHNHAFADISGLQTALDGKAPIAGVPGNWNVGSALIAGAYVSAGVGASLRIGTDTVAKPPTRNGWQNPTGPISTAAFNSQSVTLTELGKRVAAMIQELRYHGLLSPYGTTL